jgi:hypothetical protein
MPGFDASTPAIVYGSLLMSVCGGFSTCSSVSRGVTNVSRKRLKRSGRHSLSGPSPKRVPPPPRSPCRGGTG